jgi:hypothetical protein
MTEQIKLGQIILGDANRDAIHIAIAPVVADEKLAPGQDIGFVDYGNPEKVGHSISPVGIVDPFLKQMVFPSQKFFMFLYPNTVTSLRHEWTHPAFAKTEESRPVAVASKSEQWLREFSERAGLAYPKFLDIIKNAVEHDESWVEHGSDDARTAYYDVDDDVFWMHIENVTGLKRPEGGGSPFSCSC